MRDRDHASSNRATSRDLEPCSGSNVSTASILSLRRTAATLATLAVVLASGIAGAKPPVLIPVTVTPQRDFVVGDQYYPRNLSGFRRYLDAIRLEDPDLYRALAPRLSSLETRRTTAFVVGIGGAAIGIGLMLYPVFTWPGCPIGNPGFEQCSSDRSERLMTFLIVGGAVGIASLFATWLLRPDDDNFLDLVNRHNRLRSERPIRLQLGFNPGTNAGYAGLSFDLE